MRCSQLFALAQPPVTGSHDHAALVDLATLSHETALHVHTLLENDLSRVVPADRQMIRRMLEARYGPHEAHTAAANYLLRCVRSSEDKLYVDPKAKRWANGGQDPRIPAHKYCDTGGQTICECRNNVLNENMLAFAKPMCIYMERQVQEFPRRLCQLRRRLCALSDAFQLNRKSTLPPKVSWRRRRCHGLLGAAPILPTRPAHAPIPPTPLP